MKLFFFKERIFILILLCLILSFHLSKSNNFSCNKTHPILKGGECLSIYCSDKEYNSSICFINNEIIKTQWLNNIMAISDINFRYNHPFLTSKGDLIIQTTSILGRPERNFYGITNEGRYYFTDSNEKESPYFSINATKIDTTEDVFKKEGIASAVQFEYDENDYFLSVGTYGGCAELIDYKSKTITRKLAGEFYYVPIVSEKSSIFLMKKLPNDNDKKKYYIISFIILNENSYYFMCKIYYFNSTDITNGYQRVVNNYVQCANRRMTSCFQSPTTLYIFCFYQTIYYKFRVIVYEPNLNLTQKLEETIDNGESGNGNEYIFFKCIYLIDNVGFYLYYKSISSAPTIAIKEWDGNIKKYKNYDIFTLDKYLFNSNLNFNDILKIKKSQICFSSVSENQDILYIVIFNFYKDYSELMIRYYVIPLNELYNKHIYNDLTLTQYVNYVSLSSSLFSGELSISNKNDLYSYLIIFGYPNSSDIDFDLIKYLNRTNQDISNFSINLHDYINKDKIDNNIFGYIYQKIKILSVPENINMKSFSNNNFINNNYYLVKEENFSLSIPLDSQDAKEEYIIKFALIYSDPYYENLYDYVTFKDDSYASGDESQYYSDEYIGEYMGRTSFFKIIKDGYLTTNCGNNECSLCKKEKNNKAICITCRNEFTIINEEKQCVIPLISTLPETTSPIILTDYNDIKTDLTTKAIIFYHINETEDFQACLNEDILKNQCDKSITNKQIKEIYDDLKNFLFDNFTNENILLITENVVFQLSSLKEQKNKSSDYLFISNVDLGKCENLLKNKANLTDEDDLIIFKTDIKSDDLKITYIQYEIYNPYTKIKLDLDICSKESIYIYSPILITSEEESLYDSLNNSGYNLFDSHDSFYNDICATFTTKNGTDISLKDRYNSIYNNIKEYSMCQNNCTFLYYNTSTKKAKCECSAQIEDTITDKNSIDFKNKIMDKLLTVIKNSNYLVLKCYKLVFSLNGQIKNMGSYIMTFLVFIFIISMILYFILGVKKMHMIILEIIFLKKGNSNFNFKNKSKILNKNKNKPYIFNTQVDLSNNKKKKIKSNKINILSNTNLIKIKKKRGKNGPPKKRMSVGNNSTSNVMKINSKKKEICSSNRGSMNIKKKNKILNTNINDNKINKKKNNINKINIGEVKKFTKSIPFSSIELIKVNKKENEKNKALNNKEKLQKLNDQELNTLDYNLAINIDNRSYFQYYFSLLKKKHLILFTFMPSKDYNLIMIKLALFLFSLSMYFTINGFFFTDESMHNVYINNGRFDILFQISQIIYSSIIPSIIYSILKFLSLSEKDILKLKKENNLNELIQKSKKLEIFIKVKFIIFFILSFIIMIFFWYFISCFCAVYKNTQIILILDTLFSFGISMLYPFGLNLLPAILRIVSLRDPEKNKKILYKFSLYIALFI